MKIKKFFTVLTACAASLCAQAQGTSFKAQPAGELRAVLREFSETERVAPRQLSAEERAVLRRQLAQPVRQPVRRQGKRS